MTDTNTNNALTDAELDQAAGGELGGSVMPTVKDNGAVFNARGQKVGEWSFGKLYYQACGACGKPMHRGTLGFAYCDPCDSKYFASFTDVWHMSEDELKNASL